MPREDIEKLRQIRAEYARRYQSSLPLLHEKEPRASDTDIQELINRLEKPGRTGQTLPDAIVEYGRNKGRGKQKLIQRLRVLVSVLEEVFNEDLRTFVQFPPDHVDLESQPSRLAFIAERVNLENRKDPKDRIEVNPDYLVESLWIVAKSGSFPALLSNKSIRSEESQQTIIW